MQECVQQQPQPSAPHGQTYEQVQVRSLWIEIRPIESTKEPPCRGSLEEVNKQNKCE
jgi:hypothetical protein